MIGKLFTIVMLKLNGIVKDTSKSSLNIATNYTKLKATLTRKWHDERTIWGVCYKIRDWSRISTTGESKSWDTKREVGDEYSLKLSLKERESPLISLLKTMHIGHKMVAFRDLITKWVKQQLTIISLNTLQRCYILNDDFIKLVTLKLLTFSAPCNFWKLKKNVS